MSAKSFDVVIVGGGIIGAACADECARAGISVAVIEREVVGGGATAAGMGHIVVMDDSEAQFRLTRYSQLLWQRLRPELPPDAEFEQRGTIWVAADAEEMEEVHRKAVFYGGCGVPVEVMDPARLAAAEPNLRHGLAGGLLVPEDAVIYPPCAARFLLERAQAMGTRVCLGRTVIEAGNGIVRLDDGSQLTASRIVNAGGTWSPTLTPGIDVRKRKGHLVITDRYPGFVHHQLVELGYLKSAHSTTTDSVAFNVQPRKTGQVLVGSSRQFDVDGKEADAPLLARMVQRAQEYMPGLRGLSAIRVWTGFRAATPDKLPLIGPSANDPTLYLATGHEGLGITVSLGTARLLVDQMTGRPTEIPIEPYLASRTMLAETHA